MEGQESGRGNRGADLDQRQPSFCARYLTLVRRRRGRANASRLAGKLTTINCPHPNRQNRLIGSHVAIHRFTHSVLRCLQHKPAGESLPSLTSKTQNTQWQFRNACDIYFDSDTRRIPCAGQHAMHFTPPIENGRRHFVVVGLLLSTQKYKINYVVSMGHSDQTRRQVCISKHHQKIGNSPEPTALRVSSACGRYSCAAAARRPLRLAGAGADGWPRRTRARSRPPTCRRAPRDGAGRQRVRGKSCARAHGAVGAPLRVAGHAMAGVGRQHADAHQHALALDRAHRLVALRDKYGAGSRKEEGWCAGTEAIR